MRRIKILFTTVFFAAANIIIAQQAKTGGALTFSLAQAQEYALQNSPVIKNAKLDVESAKKKIWETTAIGLPQISSKLAYSYMLTVPSLISQFNSFSSLGENFGLIYGMIGALNAQAGNPYVTHIMDSLSEASSGSSSEPGETSINDMRWGLTYDITASQIIFNGSYLVGLQTVKIYKEFSDLGLTKSNNDVSESVANAYYLVLVALENSRILDSSYTNTEKILKYIISMNEQGLLEESDVDQMKLTVSTIKNARDMLVRQTEVAKNLLKFQMGLELTSDITLTDKLDVLLIPADLASLSIKDFKVENNADYLLMNTQEKLSNANLKLQKSTMLPDVFAYYNHQENFNEKSFSFTPPDMLGVSVNIPIFGSGQKLAKISQAKIAVDKAKNSKDLVAAGLKTTFINAQSTFVTAFNNYKTKKENMALAEKIYNKSIVKYKEGITGSMELTVSQNQYLQAQTEYYTSVIDLTNAKTKLEKLLK